MGGARPRCVALQAFGSRELASSFVACETKSDSRNMGMERRAWAMTVRCGRSPGKRDIARDRPQAF
jgi:hypothetical protein